MNRSLGAADGTIFSEPVIMHCYGDRALQHNGRDID
jgi:hypothetical protein